MKKQKTIFYPRVKIQNDSPIPMHHQLSEEVMRELRQCRVAGGTVLASISAMASALGLNRDTVRKAYARLEEENVIRRSPGGRILEVTAEFAEHNASEALLAIGIVLPERMKDLLNYYIWTPVETVAGIMDEAAERGIAAMVVPLPSGNEQLEHLSSWLDSMVSKLNGLVYLGEDSRHSHDRAFEILLEKKSIPQVFISGHRFREHLGIVEVDLKSAFQEEISCLYRLGHRRFAVCGKFVPVRKLFQLQTMDRFPLLCEAIREKTELDEEFVFRLSPDTWNAEPWLKHLMSLPNRPTAILCTDDEDALKIIEFLERMGFKVPADVSVAGYGDTALRRRAGLATIAHPWFQSGRAAVEMIAESCRRGIPVNAMKKVLQAPFVVRESVGRAFSDRKSDGFRR